MTLTRRAVLRSPEFAQAVDALAEESGRERDVVEREARRDLRELMASHHPVSLRVMDRFGAWLSRGYSLEVPEQEVEALRRAAADHPLLFVPNHRSYLDGFVLRRLLADEGFPPHFTLAGANLELFPLSVAARRAGMVYIRRSTRDNRIYPAMLRLYLGMLVRDGASLAWYVEGGRTRTGKLRAPRLGVLRYLVDGMRAPGEGTSAEPCVVPVAVVYDQQADLGAMAREESGDDKRPESLRGALRLGRAQSHPRGAAYVRFGEPVPLSACVAEAEARSGSSAIEKVIPFVGIDVSQRINAVTPVSPSALITFALMDTEGRAVTIAEAGRVLRPLLEYVEERGIPLTAGLSAEGSAALLEVLGTLEREGVVAQYSDGPEPVYWVSPDHVREAAFYRNSLAHWFVDRAVTETAQAVAARRGAGDAAVWPAALEIRALLRFEYFLSPIEDFEARFRAELDRVEPRTAHHIIGPFLEAYLVLADHLAAQPAEARVTGEALVRACVPLARQQYLQGLVVSPEASSVTLMSTAVQLAEASELLDDDTQVAQRRKAFASRLREIVAAVADIRQAALQAMAGRERDG